MSETLRVRAFLPNHFNEGWVAVNVGKIVRPLDGPGHIEVLTKAATGYEFERLAEGAYYPATFIVENTQAQNLMDDLWRCGIRPTEGTGSAGAMAAQTRHLEDMRTLVFKTQPEGVK